MADVKKNEKTAESGGVRNVAPDEVYVDPASPEYVTPNSAIEQAAATVPGSEAAAEQAMPSDQAVAALTKGTGKSFTQVRAEREIAEAKGEPIEPNPPYGNPNNATGVEAKPSKKTQAELDRGKKAQGDAGGFKDRVYSSADVAAKEAEIADRNKAAKEQERRVVPHLAMEEGEVEKRKAARHTEPAKA